MEAEVLYTLGKGVSAAVEVSLFRGSLKWARPFLSVQERGNAISVDLFGLYQTNFTTPP